MKLTEKSQQSLGIGFLLVFVGITLLSLVKLGEEKILEYLIPLRPNSKTYSGWQKIPFPIYQKFYYFNVTNADDVLKRGDKPKLMELGPYTWGSEWVKENITWNRNGTLQYRERKTYWFDRANSFGDQDDRIVTVNTPLLGAVKKFKNASRLMKVAIALFVKALNESIFIERSIRQLTYEGYPDVLAELSHIINKSVPVYKGRFAYMSGKNATDEGLFNIFTGVGDIRKFNQIERWNGRRKLPWWDPDTPCADIKGTNGELNSPVSASEDHIYFFNPVFCKPWKLTRDSQSVPSHGLDLTRFIAGADVLYNSSQNPEHKCFESDHSSLPSGGMDISRCQFGIPLVLSYPHFYAADPSYLERVEGLSPNRSKHQFSIDIEPRVGIALGLLARAQINIQLSRVEWLHAFQKLPDVVLPIFWQEMNIQQTPDFAKNIWMTVYLPCIVVYVLYALMVTIGLGIILVTLYRARTQQPPDPSEFRKTKCQPDLDGPVVVTPRHVPLIRKIRCFFCPRKTWSQTLRKNLDETAARITNSSTPSAPSEILNNTRKSVKSPTGVFGYYRTSSHRAEWIKNVFIPDQSRAMKIVCNVTPK